jgi:hypothetical protein
MGLFRPDRDRPPEEDPFLIWKVRLFVLGGGLGIGGMVMEMPWMLWTGVAILAAGWILRFRTGEEAAKRRVSWPSDDEDEEFEAGSGPGTLGTAAPDGTSSSRREGPMGDATRGNGEQDRDQAAG